MTVSPGWSRTRASWVVTALVAVAGLIALQVHRSSAATPYPLADMHASAIITVTDGAQAQQVADRLVGEGKLGAVSVDRIEIIGQVSLTAVGKPRDGGRLNLFLIDNRSNTLITMTSFVETADRMALGRDGRDHRLAKRYDWLKPVASAPSSDGFTYEAMALSFASTHDGPVTFLAVLDADALPVTDPARDLTLALAYVTDDDAWAVRVPVTT